MPARPPLFGLLLAVALLACACAKDEAAEATLAAFTGLTDAIVEQVAEAEDPQAGVERGRERLAEAKPELEPKLSELRSLRGFQISDQTLAKLNAELAGNVAKMSALQIELGMATARDPELAAALEQLVADHRALMTGE
jgi:hypothetical protein